MVQFSITSLKARARVQQEGCRELLFADDAALVSHSPDMLQEMITRLSSTCKSFSLVVSIKKTVTLSQGAVDPCEILLDNNKLEIVQKFIYHGSIVTANLSLDNKINGRISKAATAFGKQMKRAWLNKYLTIKTKIHIYESCILTTLLYSCETWTTNKFQERRLNIFHLRCLRKILGIRWQDKQTNNRVLELAGLPSMQTVLSQRRLTWLGHVRRMDNSRLPKQLLFGELSSGKSPTGRPKPRFKDTCKDSMLRMNIDHYSWELVAADRSK